MSAQLLADDYLYLQPLIEARLREQVLDAESIPVEGIEDLAQATGTEDKRRAVCWVYWAGDRFDESQPGRTATASFLHQRWLVLLYVRNDSARDRAARNKTAGRLLGRLHKALHGWRPGDAPIGREMRRANGPRPDYTKVSGLFPLMFEIPLNC